LIENRKEVISKRIFIKLIEINNFEIPIGIFTGRGDSIFKQIDFKLFKNLEYVFLCLYNGAISGNIFIENDSIEFLEKEEFKISLEHYEIIKNELINHGVKSKLKAKTFKDLDKIHTIQIRYIDESDKNQIIKLIMNIFYKYNFEKWYYFTDSGLTIDINNKDANKMKSLHVFQEVYQIKDVKQILTIGDKGKKLGNDYNFLNKINSLSVNEISSEPFHCFPISDENGIILKGKKALNHLISKIELETPS